MHNCHTELHDLKTDPTKVLQLFGEQQFTSIHLRNDIKPNLDEEITNFRDIFAIDPCIFSPQRSLFYKPTPKSCK